MLFGFAYCLLLGYQPQLWLWIIPAALPILDLAPLTGRFYVDEFDFLLALTVIFFLIFPSTTTVPNRQFHFTLFNLFVLFYGISTLYALFPLEEIHHTTFFTYFTQYNALRLFKGIAWAWIIYILIRCDQIPFNKRTLFNGLTLGMLLTISICIVERLIFTGFLNFSDAYRITGLFSGMHVGGAYIDAYLVLTYPVFVHVLLTQRQSVMRRLFSYVAILASVYVIYVTYSRTTYLAAVISVLPLFWLAAKHHPSHANKRLSIHTSVLVVFILLCVSILFSVGGFIHTRINHVPKDIDTRQTHWNMVLNLKQDNIFHHLFGIGLGQYPLNYFWQSEVKKRPGTVVSRQTQSKDTVLLSGGSPLYFNQHIGPHNDREFSLIIHARAITPHTHLAVYLCEKSYLFSADCLVRQIGTIAPVNEWQKIETSMTLENSSGRYQTIRDQLIPLSLGLVNTGTNSLLEIDSVMLMNRDGKPLIRNHDFHQGSQHWFFTADNHLAWHVENLFIYFLLELGLIGLMLFSALFSQLIFAAIGSYKSGQTEDIILIGGIFGLVIVGLFNSPFDFPRVLLLFGIYSICILIFESRPYDNSIDDPVSRIAKGTESHDKKTNAAAN